METPTTSDTTSGFAQASEAIREFNIALMANLPVLERINLWLYHRVEEIKELFHNEG